MPNRDVDPDAIHVVPGDRVQHQLEPGTYLALFGAETDNTELELRLSIPLPPVPHPQEAG